MQRNCVDRPIRPSCDRCVTLLQTFDEAPHWQLLKEVFSHVFATPKRHHRSKPFLDHVIAFCIADGRVWLRNYQVSVAPGEHWMSATILNVGGAALRVWQPPVVPCSHQHPESWA